MTSKERKERGRSSDSPWIVLRRRAKDLADDGYNEQYVAVFLRAADSLEALYRVGTDDERAVVETAGINRVLRNALSDIHNNLYSEHFLQKGWKDELLSRIERTLGATKKFGDGLRLMTIEIGKNESREFVEKKIATALDGFYGDATIEADGHNGEEGNDADVAESSTLP